MKPLVYFICLFFAVPIFGQRGVISYNREEGLISNEVNDLTFDAEGFLWITTNNGIDRFDGQRFIHFKNDPDDPTSICNDRVLEICFDPKGFVWASTLNGGLIRISTKDFQVKNFVHQEKVKGTISDNYITEIQSDKNGLMWFSPFQRGLDVYNPEKNQFFNYKPSREHKELDPTKSDEFTAIEADHINSNFLWCASKIGLFLFNKQLKSWSYYPLRKDRLIVGEINSPKTLEMTSLNSDAKGNLYIGTAHGELLYFDKYQGLFKLYRLKHPTTLETSEITDIEWKDSRYLYVCFNKEELHLFDTKTKTFINYNPKEFIIQQPKRITCFGNQIAVSTSNGGFYMHNDAKIFGKKKILNFEFQDFIFGESSEQWLGIDWEGGYLQQDKNLNQVQGKWTKNILYQAPAQLHSSKKFGPLIHTSHGLFSIASGQTTPLIFWAELGLKPDDFFAPFAGILDKNDCFWFGTKSNGIYMYELAKKKIYHFKRGKGKGQEINHRHTYVSSMTLHKNLLYFGCYDGIGCIDIQKKKVVPTLVSKSVPRDQIRSLEFDPKGYLWVGTLANGLYVISPENGRTLKVFQSKDGILNNQVDQTVLFHDQIWVKTTSTLLSINWKNYSLRSLEVQNGIENISKIVPSDTKLYFIQRNSYIEVSKKNSRPQMNYARPYIQRVHTINSTENSLNQKMFAYYENNISFKFGVQDYSTTGNNHVSYRLKGLEEKWRSGNSKDDAEYYNIPGGDYVFQVKVIKNGTPTYAFYSFSVIPPFWKTWYFIFISIVVTFSIVFIYLRERINQIKNNEYIRTEFNKQINEMEAKALRAQMNPHFLFNSLNSIRLFLLKNEVQNASDYITKFSKLLRMILNHSRLDLIPVKDEIQSLRLYMEFERLRFDSGFKFELLTEGDGVLDCSIPPMIIQPFVENAIWHGLMPRQDDLGKISVLFNKTTNGLRVIVEDNGIGREEAAKMNKKTINKEGSVGLQITKDRLRSLSKRTKRMNDYVMEDLYDEFDNPCGTKIELFFELEDSNFNGI